MKLLRDLFTGIDGQSYDLGRVLLAGGALVMIGAGVVGVYHTHALDFVAFGAGFDGLLTGGGALLLMKRQTEPSLVTATKTDPAGNTSTASVETGAP